MPDNVLVSSQLSIQTITLNRPEKRNSLNADVVEELSNAFNNAALNADIRVLILTGNGPAFCAGADLSYLQQISVNTPLENAADSRNLMIMFQKLRTFPKPTIAKIHGPALAGGCGLALACDIIVADEEARFGFTEVRIGFVPAIVMKILVERIGMGRAREILLRGNILSSEAALKIGMINYAVRNEELDEFVEKLAVEITEKISPEAVHLTKQLLLEIESLDLLEAMKHAADFNALSRTTLDFRKGINSFLNKEKLSW